MGFFHLTVFSSTFLTTIEVFGRDCITSFPFVPFQKEKENYVSMMASSFHLRGRNRRRVVGEGKAC